VGNECYTPTHSFGWSSAWRSLSRGREIAHDAGDRPPAYLTRTLSKRWHPSPGTPSTVAPGRDVTVRSTALRGEELLRVKTAEDRAALLVSWQSRAIHPHADPLAAGYHHVIQGRCLFQASAVRRALLVLRRRMYQPLRLEFIPSPRRRPVVCASGAILSV
jgi:hypothetical protein